MRKKHYWILAAFGIAFDRFGGLERIHRVLVDSGNGLSTSSGPRGAIGRAGIWAMQHSKDDIYNDRDIRCEVRRFGLPLFFYADDRHPRRCRFYISWARSNDMRLYLFVDEIAHFWRKRAMMLNMEDMRELGQPLDGGRTVLPCQLPAMLTRREELCSEVVGVLGRT